MFNICHLLNWNPLCIVKVRSMLFVAIILVCDTSCETQLNIVVEAAGHESCKTKIHVPALLRFHYLREGEGSEKQKDP